MILYAVAWYHEKRYNLAYILVTDVEWYSISINTLSCYYKNESLSVKITAIVKYIGKTAV